MKWPWVGLLLGACGLASGCGARTGLWVGGVSGGGGPSRVEPVGGGGAATGGAGSAPIVAGASGASVAYATNIDTGQDTNCVLLSDGSLRCWGAAWSGRLGDGVMREDTAQGSAQPEVVSGIPAHGGRAIDVSVGQSSACALLDDGTVWCWGSNNFDQLGGPDAGARSFVPLPVPILNDAAGVHATALSVGNMHACAVLSDASVRCWGANTVGQLGEPAAGVMATPRRVLGLPPVTEPGPIAAGGGHTCVATSPTTVSCWGDNNSGQLGNGSPGGTAAAQQVAGLPCCDSSIQALSAGDSHTCASYEDGSVFCWGSNSTRALGSGSERELEPRAVRVIGLGTGGARAVAISASSDGTCAVIDDGSIQCWGRDQQVELAEGVDPIQPRPLPVAGLPIGLKALRVARGGSHSCALFDDRRARCWGSNYYSALGSNAPPSPPQLPALTLPW